MPTGSRRYEQPLAMLGSQSMAARNTVLPIQAVRLGNTTVMFGKTKQGREAVDI